VASAFKAVLPLAILTTSLTVARAAEQEVTPADLIGSTVCEVESNWGGHGLYEPFGKDPNYIEFANVIMKGNRAFVFVIEKKSEERCSWRIAAALEVGSGIGEQSIESANVMSFNCAVLHQRFRRHVGYFGLIPHSAMEEYVTPVKAWSVDLESMRFSELKTANIFCPNFIADAP
jgi:hypothetical protein